MSEEMEKIKASVEQYHPYVQRMLDEAGKVIVGQRYLLERLLMGLLLEGHILVEGVPGLAKTTAVRALAKVLQVQFQRIQFTPDLLPADIIGTEIYNPKTQSFGVKKGPIFSNIILADEINRAPAKVQSALLEAMQERQVTIGAETFALEFPFIVLATQNPIEQEGTYPLPEAQVDRFMLKLNMGYPSHAEEIEIMDRVITGSMDDIEAQLSADSILAMKKLIKSIYVDQKIKEYIVNIITATRDPEKLVPEFKQYIQFGASPRGSINLNLAARCYAFMQGRAFVTPQDVKTMAYDVLRHRILLTYVAEAEELGPDQIIKEILNKVEVP